MENLIFYPQRLIQWCVYHCQVMIPFQVTENNAEMMKAKALNRLMKELDEGSSDPVSYAEDEVYKILGVDR